jgi:hypothetical protein
MYEFNNVSDILASGAFDGIPKDRLESPPSVDSIPIEEPPAWLNIDEAIAGKAGLKPFEKKPKENPEVSKLRFPCQWHWDIEIRDAQWLIDGWIEAGSLGVLFGPAESFKSFVAVDMACSIAAGVKWHGRNTKGCGPIVYVLGEGAGGFRRRIKAWALRHGLADQDVRLLAMPAFMADDDAQVMAAIDSIREFLGDEIPCLVILDTLNRAMSGDENSTRDMTGMVHGLDAIRNSLSCAVLAIHHSGWSDKTRVRGSSALHGSLDVAIRAERINDVVRLEATKIKEAERPEPVYLEAIRMDLGTINPDNGQPMTSLVMVDTTQPEISETIPKTGDKLQLMQVVLCEMLDKRDEAFERAGKEPDGRIPYGAWVEECRKRGVSRQVISHNRKRFVIRDGFVYGA